MLYLDNSATTQVLPEVKDAMLPYLIEEYGNPSSKYYTLAENARKAVEESRFHVAQLVGCESDSIIFTSGATESNNFIIKGIAHYYKNQSRHIVTSAVEHPSVLETCKFLEGEGWTVTYLSVDKYARIYLNELETAIQKEKPALVSIMWGNNELGSLNDIEGIVRICKSYDVLFHTDATQVIGKVPVDLKTLDGVNFLSGSAHKYHGPKGVGFAYIGKDALGLPIQLTPLLHGGGQENELRSGTLAVHNIVGIGKASELAHKNLNANITKLEALDKTLITILEQKFSKHISFNHDNAKRIPGVLNVLFKGINNETLVRSLAPIISVSTGSACSSTKPSHVLREAGLSIEEVRNCVRFSLNSLVKQEELKLFETL